MKSNISTVWLVGLVITFLMVFSAYIIITVDYSKNFKLKNEVLNIIEKNKGMTSFAGTETTSIITGDTILSNVGSLKTINAFLAASNYDAKGPCGKDNNSETWYGVKKMLYGSGDNVTDMVETAQDGVQYYYCFAKYSTGRASKEAYDSVYYKVQLFYKFEIPVIREFLPIRIDGITDEIYRPYDDGFHRNSDYFSNT